MLSKVVSFGLVGISGFPVFIEADVYSGMPAYEIVGLPDAAVKESRERVRSAIKNSGFSYPTKRITINLAPADMKKEGPVYDLAMAVALLVADGQLGGEGLDKMAVFGELALNGDVRYVNGILPMVIEARQRGYETVVVPKDNAKEASYIEGIRVLPAQNLKELTDVLCGGKAPGYMQPSGFAKAREDVAPAVDFKDIKGQAKAKRAMEIAAAGGHNILLIGSAGTGKSMLAKALPGVLPELTFEECLEVTKIHSVAGELKKNAGGIVETRPMRAPHHTASQAAITGGGQRSRPGEVSLAHRGVLYFDELPEFKRDVLEALRQPLEDRVISVSRVNSKVSYPADVMFVASMNPCPCGNYGSAELECRCSPGQISRYLSRISGPLLDRIDIQVEMSNIKYEDITDKTKQEDSASVKARVDEARKRQLARYEGSGIFCNAELDSALIEERLEIAPSAKTLLKAAFDALHLSARSYTRVVMAAQTIADLEGSEKILDDHIAEAVQYRTLDRKYWGQGL